MDDIDGGAGAESLVGGAGADNVAGGAVLTPLMVVLEMTH